MCLNPQMLSIHHDVIQISNILANTTHQDETCNSLTQGCPETGSKGGTQCAMWRFSEASWTFEEVGRFAYPPQPCSAVDNLMFLNSMMGVTIS